MVCAILLTPSLILFAKELAAEGGGGAGCGGGSKSRLPQ